MQAFPDELAWGDPGGPFLSLALKVLLLLWILLRLELFPAVAPRRYHMVALAAGLLGMMFLIILASYYQYSMWGFERHRTFFQCTLVLLLLVAGRALSLRWRVPVRVAGTLGPSLLLVVMALDFGSRLSGIVADYGLLPAICAARFQTWDSGTRPRDASAVRTAAAWAGAGGYGLADRSFLIADRSAENAVVRAGYAELLWQGQRRYRSGRSGTPTRAGSVCCRRFGASASPVIASAAKRSPAWVGAIS